MDFGDVIGDGFAPMPDFWLAKQTTGEASPRTEVIGRSTNLDRWPAVNI